MLLLTVLAAAIGGYLVGSIPAGLVLVRLVKGVDLREHGSGKTGATNVLRMLGPGAGIAILVADASKGAIGVALGHLFASSFGFAQSEYGAVTGALAAIAGHNWPIFAGFRGGRGVAASLGALVLISPLTALIALPVALATILISDMASLGSLGGAALGLLILLLQIALGALSPLYALFAGAATTSIVVLHRDNIRRLRRGEERKLGLRDRLRREL